MGKSRGVRLAAIDQGTTSTRLLAVEPGRPPAIVASRRHRTRYPHPGWVEQDATELLGNVRAVLDQAGSVDAIGLANQGESCLAWDAPTGEPLSPVIVWQDNRTADRLAAMARDGVAPEVLQRSGLPLDPYFSAGKLAWLLENLPPVAAAHAAGRLRLGTTDAFFLDRLTGTAATDRATASRTGLMNIATGAWDPELCRLFGLPLGCLPPIRPNTAGFGTIGSTPVAAAVVDQQAALYGHGCRAPVEGKITFGTGAFALAVAGREVPRDASAVGLLPTVAWDLGDGPVYAVDGGVPDAGAAVDWAIRAGLVGGLEELAGFEGPPAITRGLVCVPAFSGLGCPRWDRTAAPLFLGLRPDTTGRDMARALLEGVAFLTAEVFAAMTALSGPPAALRIDGGLSRNGFFAGMLAECCGVPVVASGFSDLTAWGTAALAAVALGEDIGPAPGGSTTYVPEGRLAPADRDRFRHALERSGGWWDGSERG